MRAVQEDLFPPPTSFKFLNLQILGRSETKWKDAGERRQSYELHQEIVDTNLYVSQCSTFLSF